jgi:hypothetical protein
VVDTDDALVRRRPLARAGSEGLRPVARQGQAPGARLAQARVPAPGGTSNRSTPASASR